MPPFFIQEGGHSTFDFTQPTVQPVKDEGSEMAQSARRGSALVAAFREDSERSKQYHRLSGSNTVLGSLLGRPRLDEAVEEGLEDDALHNGTDSASGTHSKDHRASQNRHSLPAYECRREIAQLVRENQVVVIVGETGSGKTTQVPQILLDEGLGGSGRGAIACTQPRRVAAVSVAKRVALERNCVVGEEVGYSIRFEDCTGGATMIKYMTDGVLLRETLRDPDMDSYAVVIVDEAHERSLQTDILLGLLKRVLQRRRDIRVVVMSATLDASRFSAYFDGAPVFTIPGRNYPVDIFYAQFQPSDYVEEAVRQTVNVHLTMPPGDILVFLAGQEEIDAACHAIRTRLALIGRVQQSEVVSDRLLNSNVPNPGHADIASSYTETDMVGIAKPPHPCASSARHEHTGKAEEDVLKSDDQKARLESTAQVPPLALLPMYAALSPEMQSRVFQDAPDGVRRCIVSTNIAETSLTLDGVRYVIDSGFSKIKVYSSRTGIDALQVYPISQASARQRAGRSGRSAPGTCYRLYTHAAFDQDMLASSIPEALRTNLANVALLLKTHKVHDIASFEFIDTPSNSAIDAACAQLWLLGALDDLGNLSLLGNLMAQLPLEPHVSRMLIAAEQLECVDDALVLAAMLSAPRVFFRSRERSRESDEAHARFTHPGSDHITLINVFKQWIGHNRSDSWCRLNFLHARALRYAESIYAQLSQHMAALRRDAFPALNSAVPESNTFRQTDLHPSLLPDTNDRLRWCIAAAAAGVQRVARYSAMGKYVNVVTGAVCSVHPSSVLYGLSDMPEYVVYNEMVLTSMEYMSGVTAIDPLWLCQSCSGMFSLRIADGETAETLGIVRFASAIKPYGDSIVHRHASNESQSLANSDEESVVILPHAKRRLNM